MYIYIYIFTHAHVIDVHYVIDVIDVYDIHTHSSVG